MEYYEASTSAGVVDSVLAAAANTVIFTYNVVAMGTNLTQSLFARELGSEYGDRRYEYPVPLIPWDAADNYLENNASKVWNMESYHAGRCGGDVLVTVGSLAVGTYGVYNGLKNVSAGIRFGSNGGKLFALVNGQAAGGTLGLVTSGTKALNVVGTALADAVAYDALADFQDRVSRIGGDKSSGGSLGLKGEANSVKPEAAVTGSKKHGVKWKEGPARAKATGNPQGQWAPSDLDYATEMANTLKPGESGYFDLPEGGTVCCTYARWNNSTGNSHVDSK